MLSETLMCGIHPKPRKQSVVPEAKISTTSEVLKAFRKIRQYFGRRRIEDWIIVREADFHYYNQPVVHQMTTRTIADQLFDGKQKNASRDLGYIMMVSLASPEQIL